MRRGKSKSEKGTDMVNEKLIKGGQGRSARSLEEDCTNVAALFLIAVIAFVFVVSI